jgi:hypothetical protein
VSQSAARQQRRAQKGNGKPDVDAALLKAAAAGGKILNQPERQEIPQMIHGEIVEMLCPMRVLTDPAKREILFEFVLPTERRRYRMARDLAAQLRASLGDALDSLDQADKDGVPLS